MYVGRRNAFANIIRKVFRGISFIVSRGTWIQWSSLEIVETTSMEYGSTN